MNQKALTPFILALIFLLGGMLVTGVIGCVTQPSHSYSLWKPATGTHAVIPSLKRIYKASYSVFTFDFEKPPRLVGSGTFIKNHANSKIRMLTAWHVVKAAEKYGTVLIGNELESRFIPVRLLKKQPNIDLALLESLRPYPGHPFVDIATMEPIIGERLTIIGSPRGNERNVSSGLLSSIVYKYHLKNRLQIYRTDADIFYGNSGGGAFNKKGELIGVACFAETMGGGIIIPGGGLIVSLPHVLNFLSGT